MTWRLFRPWSWRRAMLVPSSDGQARDDEQRRQSRERLADRLGERIRAAGDAAVSAASQAASTAENRRLATEDVKEAVSGLLDKLDPERSRNGRH